jgi:hypothetical protein
MEMKFVEQGEVVSYYDIDHDQAIVSTESGCM